MKKGPLCRRQRKCKVAGGFFQFRNGRREKEEQEKKKEKEDQDAQRRKNDLQCTMEKIQFGE